MNDQIEQEQGVKRPRIPGYTFSRIIPSYEGALLALSVLWSVIITPAAVHAECSVMDFEACADSTQYSIYMGFAGQLWQANRVFLSLTYTLEQLRWWLINQAFTSLYQTLVDTLSPGLIPFATVAVIIGVVSFLVTPVFGKLNIVDVRRALVWCVVAPLLLTLSGPWLAQVEDVRVNIGTIFFNAAAQVAPGAIFGSPGTDMPPPTPLYDPPVGVCGGDPLKRPTFGSLPLTGGPQIQMDDMAAAMMYADASDIHCPEREAPGQDIPDGFFGTPSPNYAVESIDNFDAPRRKEAIANIQRGIRQLSFGLIPSLLSSLFAFIQLMFSFALVTVWISLPIGLLFVFFTETAGGVTGTFRKLVGVLQSSWSSSLIMGILFAAILASTQLGNASAYTGLSLAGIFMSLYLVKASFDTLASSFKSIGEAVGAGTGLSGGANFAGAAAGMAVGGGVGAVAGGIGMAQTYAAASQASGSTRYGLAAAAGRLRPIARIGELAAASGYGGELTDAIYTGWRGSRAHDGWRSVDRLARADGSKRVETPDGRSMTRREVASERQLARQVRRDGRGSPFEQSVQAWKAVGRGIQRAATVPVRVGDAVERGVVTRSVSERARAGGRTAVAAVTDRLQPNASRRARAGALVGAASAGFTRDRSTMRMGFDGTQIQYHKRIADDLIPEEAITERAKAEDIAAWLRDEQFVQRNSDGTTTHWPREAALRTPPPPPPPDDGTIVMHFPPVSEAKAIIMFEEAKHQRRQRNAKSQQRDMTTAQMLDELREYDPDVRRQRSRLRLQGHRGAARRPAVQAQQPRSQAQRSGQPQAIPAASGRGTARRTTYISKQREVRRQIAEAKQNLSPAQRRIALRQQAYRRSAQRGAGQRRRRRQRTD